MLQDDGAITFVTEIVEAVCRLLATYEAEHGPFADELERGLAISYLLGAMCCDVERCWDKLATHPAFDGTHPKRVFEEFGADCSSERLDGEITQALQSRGWLPRDG